MAPLPGWRLVLIKLASASSALRAQMDLIVALTACAAEMSNNYKLKPIGYEISGPPAQT